MQYVIELLRTITSIAYNKSSTLLVAKDSVVSFSRKTYFYAGVNQIVPLTMFLVVLATRTTPIVDLM